MHKEKVFLIHGLFMHGAMMLYLRNQLQKHGYHVFVFSYHSTLNSLSDNAQLLVDFVETHRQDNDVCHFVGHSLGGLLIRLSYEIAPCIFTGNIVTLGTPHQGSLVAHRVANDLHETILGGAYPNALDGILPDWQGKVALGSIAGTACIGIGMALNALPKPNDGTVSVLETQLVRQSDHITVPISHTALIYSSQVAQQTVYFLRNQKFLSTA